MTNCYVESSIAILNDKTKDLNNLNELGIYLANQYNPNALQTLKLMILAKENYRLDKDFDINAIKKYTVVEALEKRKREENIVNNLAKNPSNLGLDLFELIIKNYKVNLHIQPFDSGYTTLDFWIRSLKDIEYKYNTFYKRYDMIDKKLDIIEYLLESNLINKEDIQNIIYTLNACINDKYNFTKEQLFRMQTIVNSLVLKKQLRNNISKLAQGRKISVKCDKDLLVEKLLEIEKESNEEVKQVDRREFFHEELINFWMNNEDCWYISDTIPKLIKNKIIK